MLIGVSGGDILSKANLEVMEIVSTENSMVNKDWVGLGGCNAKHFREIVGGMEMVPQNADLVGGVGL